MFWSDQLKKYLPIYLYYIDLGRGRGNKKYFNLDPVHVSIRLKHGIGADQDYFMLYH